MRPVLIELVGPAGAGKTTVLAALHEQDVIRDEPSLTRGRNAATLSRHVASTFAMLATRRALSRVWTRQALIMAAALRARPVVLSRFDPPPETAYVLEHGPIYTLTRPWLADERIRGWREGSLEIWRSLLDLVVWIDAPTPVLNQRITTRSGPHRLKHAPPETAVEALEADRRSLERALAEFVPETGGPTLLRFDSGELSADEIAAEIAAEIRRRFAAGARRGA